MPRVPVGLPQSNLDAPRLLAHCFLFEIDELLAQGTKIDFARYMDDIDIGVDSIAEGRIVLRDLDLALQTRQIRLNSGKTKILGERAARQHFKIRENLLIDKLASLIETKIASKTPTDKEKRKIELAIRVGLRRDNFAIGNGDKIFKRLINLARLTHADISDAHFFEVLSNWPSLRQTILTWWQHSTNPEAKLHLIAALFSDGGLVDDAAKMDATVALVAARLPKTKFVTDMLFKITSSLNQKSSWDFYAKAWLLSKYGSDDELISLIETTVSLWVTQEHLSRLVAGLFSRFIASKHRAKFEAIVRRAGNSWSLTVLQFHLELTAETKGYTAIRNFVLAKNTSLPNGISHSKFLILLSLLSNPDIAPIAVAHLKKVHLRALSDAYYSSL